MYYFYPYGQLTHVATHDLQRPAWNGSNCTSFFYVRGILHGQQEKDLFALVFLHLHRVTKSRRRVLFSHLSLLNQSSWLPLFLIINARWSSLDAVPRFVEWDGA
jgi:hypothetical protein